MTTIPFLLLFGITLVAFDVAGRVALLFGMRPFEHVMASLQRWLMWLFWVCGVRVKAERDPSIKPGTGYAIISNHQSLLDIAMIGGLLYSNFPKYVAKAELGSGIPSISLNLKRGGNALIDRSDRVQAVRAIVRMAKTAQERGVSVVIFPEGTRSTDGTVGEFKRAGSEALLQAASALPVVPTAIDGSWKIAKMFPVAFGSVVRIRFGAPIERQAGDAGSVLEQSREFIERTLAEWRSSAP